MAPGFVLFCFNILCTLEKSSKHAPVCFLFIEQQRFNGNSRENRCHVQPECEGLEIEKQEQNKNPSPGKGELL